MLAFDNSEAGRLLRRLERIEDELGGLCCHSRRINELREEREAVLRRLEQLGFNRDAVSSL